MEHKIYNYLIKSFHNKIFNIFSESYDKILTLIKRSIDYYSY